MSKTVAALVLEMRVEKYLLRLSLFLNFENRRKGRMVRVGPIFDSVD